jgi:hypothetical protein
LGGEFSPGIGRKDAYHPERRILGGQAKAAIRRQIFVNPTHGRYWQQPLLTPDIAALNRGCSAAPALIEIRPSTPGSLWRRPDFGGGVWDWRAAKFGAPEQKRSAGAKKCASLRANGDPREVARSEERNRIAPTVQSIRRQR